MQPRQARENFSLVSRVAFDWLEIWRKILEPIISKCTILMNRCCGTRYSELKIRNKVKNDQEGLNQFTQLRKENSSSSFMRLYVHENRSYHPSFPFRSLFMI